MSKPRTLARSHKIGRARRPRVSVWQQLNQAREVGLGLFGNKRAVLGIVIIALAMGAIVLAQGPLFHSYKAVPLACHIFPSWSSPECLDPIQTIWNATASDGFNLYAGNKTITTVTNCFDLAANSASCLTFHSFQANSTLVALSKATVGDLSVASKYTLGIVQSIAFDTLITTNARWGYYLTTNGTIPHHAIGSTSAYRPEFDPSVILSGEFFCNTSCGTASPSIYQTIKLLRTIGQTDTIESERTLTCGEGSQFLCRAQVIPNDFSVCPNGSFSGCLSSATYLNFTGIVNGQACTITNPTGIGPAPGCSWIENSPYATIDSTKWGSSQTLPWMQVQAAQYYIGFYASTGSGNIGFAFDNGPHSTSPAFAGMKIFLYTPQPSGPTIDTGGFFGPVIKALISLGVFIVQNVFNFAIYLYNILAPIGTAIFNLAAGGLAAIIGIFYNVVKTILNSIGSILGLGTLGDNLFQLLAGLADWFAQFFGTIINIAFSGNLVNALNQLLTFNVTLLVPYWAALTTWLIALGDYLSLFWSTAALFSKISISMLLSFWLLYGALRFSRSMASGMEWYHTTGYFTMLGVSITWYFLVIIINYVIIPIVHIITAGSTTLGARPKIEVAGTSTP